MSETRTPATLEEQRKAAEDSHAEWEEGKEALERTLSEIALDALTGDEEALRESEELEAIGWEE
jgi:hypothetical protein